MDAVVAGAGLPQAWPGCSKRCCAVVVVGYDLTVARVQAVVAEGLHNTALSMAEMAARGLANDAPAKHLHAEVRPRLSRAALDPIVLFLSAATQVVRRLSLLLTDWEKREREGERRAEEAQRLHRAALGHLRLPVTLHAALEDWGV